MKHGYLVLALAASLLIDPLIARADYGWVPYGSSRIRRELREGAREIRRERREAFREIMDADSPREFRRELREGAREIRRERRELRREVRRELYRSNFW